ncbi:MAG: type II toxin-antitoxin system VapC family toxin [Deltaproteobacteria bacterium]|nr:type II toxin-antitoxin system VapC family toxin [Deltaproteobacteria bacterium]
MSYLLDTCVISELVKPRPSAAVTEWVAGQDEASLFLSVLTLGELEKGIAKLTEAKKRTKLEAWVREDLAERFEGRVLPIDVAVASRWGALSGEAERKGSPVPVIDGLISATALEHGLTVVSRNVGDFEVCGVACLNPWG